VIVGLSLQVVLFMVEFSLYGALGRLPIIRGGRLFTGALNFGRRLWDGFMGLIVGHWFTREE